MKRLFALFFLGLTVLCCTADTIFAQLSKLDGRYDPYGYHDFWHTPHEQDSSLAFIIAFMLILTAIMAGIAFWYNTWWNNLSADERKKREDKNWESNRRFIEFWKGRGLWILGGLFTVIWATILFLCFYDTAWLFVGFLLSIPIVIAVCVIVAQE
jgi:hypothetical protein